MKKERKQQKDMRDTAVNRILIAFKQEKQQEMTNIKRTTATHVDEQTATLLVEQKATHVVEQTAPLNQIMIIVTEEIHKQKIKVEITVERRMKTAITRYR